MKYSIIIPHINEGYYIDIMIDSIYNNFNYKNFEIIIVDDGSKNLKDLDFVKNHKMKDKIKIFFQESLGVANARNFGAQQSEGDILIFFDAHLYFIDDFLSKLDNVLQKFSEIDLLQPIIGSFTDKNIKGHVYKIKDFILNSTWDEIKTFYDKENSLVEVPNIAGGGFIIKKDVFFDLDGFCKFFEKWGSNDLELSMRAFLNGYKSFLSLDLFTAHYFRKNFDNTFVDTKDILNNKIMFAKNCFDGNFFDKIMFELQNNYTNLYDDVFDTVKNNSKYYEWLLNQRKKYLYDIDVYFGKFKDYYQKFVY